MLFRNWLSKKWAATWAGNKLYRIRLFDSCSTAISRFSCDACSCHKKSSLAVHSTCRPWARMAIIKMIMRASEIVCSGIVDLLQCTYMANEKYQKSNFLWNEDQNKKLLTSLSNHSIQRCSYAKAQWTEHRQFPSEPQEWFSPQLVAWK